MLKELEFNFKTLSVTEKFLLCLIAILTIVILTFSLLIIFTI